MIFENSRVKLRKDSPILRIPPRREEDKQQDYDNGFDFTTLFSDIFYIDNHIKLVSPPPLNLHEVLLSSTFEVENEVLPLIDFQIKDRLATGSIPCPSSHGGLLTIKNELGEWSVPIQQSAANRFAGLRVLVTHQKDNPLEWIAYWACFNQQINDIDAIVIYDNGSESYSVEDLNALLGAIDGLKAFAVINWDTPFGLTGGPNGVWDSDFGQHIFLEDVRYRFLLQAKSVLICDVDELPVSTSENKLLDMLEDSSEPALFFPRRQVLHILDGSRDEEELRVHRNYRTCDARGLLLNTKYAFVPSRLQEKHQLKVHYVLGIDNTLPAHETPVAGHFGGIRIDWRNGEKVPVGNIETWPRLTCDADWIIPAFEEVEPLWQNLCMKINFN